MCEFTKIALAHAARYPLMLPQDFGKLAYQSAFGPEHMVEDAPGTAAFILSEWQAVDGGGAPVNPEPIGGGLCRFHMTRGLYSPENAAELARRFAQSAREHTGTKEGLEARLRVLARLPIDGMDAWLSLWRERGCPPVRHSEAFRAAYRPHYRVLRLELADSLTGPRKK